MNRRQLLAGLGLGGLAGLLSGRRARAAGVDDPLLIVYFVKGGWDPSYVFDPHPLSAVIQGDPEAELVEVGGIPLAVAASRPAVTDFFAAYGPQSVVVNGVAVGSISHVTCTRLMYTGALVEGSADMASWIGAGRGAGQILPNLILSGPRFPGAFGASAIPLSSLLFGVAQGQSPAGAAYVADDEAAIRDWLRGEAEGLRFPGASALGADLVTGLGRRAELEAVAGEFDGYTGVTEAEQVGAALTALSLGLSRCVCLEGDVPGFGQWDSHQDNAGNQSRCYEHLFGRLSTLMAGLSATAGPAGGSLLDQTTVLVLSEMGRTPVENAAGGKDHWPYTSALLVGAGLDGGRVVGATDDSLVGLAVDPEDGLPTEAGARIGPAELLAGLLERFDIDPDPIWPGVRPLRAPWSG
jgi:hypothetical protein